MANTTQQELEAHFEQACTLIIHSQAHQDREMLACGIELMKSTSAACRQRDDFSFLQPSLDRISASVDLPRHIRAYKTDKASGPYFDLLLAHFPPTLGDITRENDDPALVTKLVKSLLQHDAERSHDDRLLKTFDFNALLRHLGATSSKEGFALALDESFKRLDAQDIEPHWQQGFRVRVLPLINDYVQPKTTDQALPVEILDVLARHLFQILAEHNKYRQEDGGFLRLDVLQAMLAHSPSSERMTDVILEMARNSEYQLKATSHLLWIEQLGIPVDVEKAARKLIGYANQDDRQAALYYLLSSPSVSARKLSQVLEKITNGIEPVVPMISLSAGIRTFKQDGEEHNLFIDKSILLIKHLLVKDPNTAHAILGARWLPGKHIKKDHVLRDHMMASDLGL